VRSLLDALLVLGISKDKKLRREFNRKTKGAWDTPLSLRRSGSRRTRQRQPAELPPRTDSRCWLVALPHAQFSAPSVTTASHAVSASERKKHAHELTSRVYSIHTGVLFTIASTSVVSPLVLRHTHTHTHTHARALASVNPLSLSPPLSPYQSRCRRLNSISDMVFLLARMISWSCRAALTVARACPIISRPESSRACHTDTQTRTPHTKCG
jgi:hypothetical protein